MMRVLAIFMRLLGAVFKLFPLKRRVTLLSRQSHVPSPDFRLLAAQLASDDPTLDVCVNTCDSELSGWVPYARHTLVQLWLASTSRVVVLDGYNPAVSIPSKRKGVSVIQLWHAAGAIKRFGYQCLDTPAGRTKAQARAACMHRNYDVIVAAGPGAIDPFSEAFGYPRDVVSALGLPHVGQLLKRGDSGRDAALLRERHPWLTNGKLNVLYAPTLRRDGSDHWLTDVVRELTQALRGYPVNLIVSKHPLTQIDEASLAQDAHVHVLSNHSTTSLLAVADVMVSDYSAMALEAGLVGIPVLFYVPDIEQYRTSPGLNIDPVTHGQLFGTSSAVDLAHALGNRDQLDAIHRDYQSFISGYFAGVSMTASTQRIARLIEERLV